MHRTDCIDKRIRLEKKLVHRNDTLDRLETIKKRVITISISLTKGKEREGKSLERGEHMQFTI